MRPSALASLSPSFRRGLGGGMLALLLFMPLAASAAGHVTLRDTLTTCEIYPGTVHTLEVTVPDCYDPATPAALVVGLDGPLCNAPAVIDSLMAAGRLPVTIGVWLQPGRITAADGTVLRYNRSNEFDAIDDCFVHFLATEVLPAVQRLSTPDGRPVRLSDNAADRMIMGLSSGGIAAMVAAFHRPDLFGRVFSGVGTFVAMRGGNDLQALVRKTESLPLRVYLQDGTLDAWNPLFGHWYEGNRMLATALEFAGVSLRCDWSDSGHNVRRATEVFPEALEWLWSEPPTVGHTSNDFLQALLPDGEDHDWHEAEPWDIANDEEFLHLKDFYPDSTIVVWWDNSDNCLWQGIRGEKGAIENAQRFYYLHYYNRRIVVTHMEFDAAGNLWVATDAGLQICDQNGRVRAILRYPASMPVPRSIVIGEGYIDIIGKQIDSRHRVRYRRALRVRPVTPGVRPPSQGQG